MYGDPKICPSAKACLEWIQIKQMADTDPHMLLISLNLKYIVKRTHNKVVMCMTGLNAADLSRLQKVGAGTFL